VNPALTLSNILTARENTLLTMSNTHFEEIVSTKNGIQRKHRKSVKPGPI